MEAWQQIGVVITAVVMFLSGMLAGVLAAYNRFRDGRWRLPKDIDWVDETLRAEAEVRALREALEAIVALDEHKLSAIPNGMSVSDWLSLGHRAIHVLAVDALAPEPPESK